MGRGGPLASEPVRALAALRAVGDWSRPGITAFCNAVNAGIKNGHQLRLMAVFAAVDQALK